MYESHIQVMFHFDYLFSTAIVKFANYCSFSQA